MAAERRIEKRAAAVRQGNKVDGVYLVVEGRLKLLLTGPSGRVVALGLVGPGGSLRRRGGDGRDAVVLYGAGPRGEPCPRLARGDIRRCRGTLPRVARNLLRLYAGEREAEWGRLHELVTEPVGRRLARLILRLAEPAGGGRPPAVVAMQPDLAELLGTTPPTLSRILGRWEARGIVGAGRERIVVTDPGRARRYRRAR
jgi:CRP-like cAMP-binding protein